MRLATALREHAGGQAVVVLTVSDDPPPTVAGLLDALADAHPAAGRRVRDEQGRLRRHVNVFVGEDNCRQPGGLDAPLVAGTEVSILPAVSGGTAE